MLLKKNEKWLTLKQASEILDMSVSALYSWCRKGAMPCYHFGDKIKLTETDLAAFIANAKKEKIN
jgi:excisionase family DNA binding protein